MLCDVIFDGGYWHAALDLIARSHHPLVTMLVIADPVDRPFLDGVFARGACGIIWKPFEFAPVMRQIRTVHEASKERHALLEESGHKRVLFTMRS